MRLQKNHWLYTTPIAHRGLFSDTIVENSISAYKKAIDFGYAIEIDVYSSIDGELFCFHDKTLDRMTGKCGNIFDKTSKEIKKLHLKNTTEKIPTLKEVLSLCENKTPLLIEIKNQPRKDIVEKVVNTLKSYSGEFAIQSFNPLYIKKVKKLAPDFIRGILASKTPDTNKKLERFVVKRMPFNFLAKPDFISIEYTSLPIKTKLLTLAWTVTSQQTLNEIKPYINNFIFENFLPE